MAGALWFVATDAQGIEHSPSGEIAWDLPCAAPSGPAPGPGSVSRDGPALRLRNAEALLEVLDECIFEAEATSPPTDETDGTVGVASARLVRKTAWDTEHAAQFAIDCATHVLGPDADVPLPDGSTFAQVLEEAQADLNSGKNEGSEHLGTLERGLALHRLRRERKELGEMAIELIEKDASEHVDPMDDPAYESLEPLIDSVLAAIAALRHHARIGALARTEERVEERFDHRLDEGELSVRTPTPIVTPWGAFELGGNFVPRYDPAWVAAREGARHARTAAGTRGGIPAERRERSWQAALLESMLELA